MVDEYHDHQDQTRAYVDLVPPAGSLGRPRFASVIARTSHAASLMGDFRLLQIARPITQFY